MRHTFYDSTDYQEGQSKIVKTAWQKGSYRHLLAKTEKRKCKRENCNNIFEVKSFSPIRRQELRRASGQILVPIYTFSVVGRQILPEL